MSTPTTSAAETIASATTPQAVGKAFEVPLLRLLSLLPSIWAAFTYTLRLVYSILKPLLVLSPVPILLYVLAPLIKFIEILVEVVVWTPYRIFNYLVEALLPLYTFVGVACITGLILGLAGRIVCWKLANIVNPQLYNQLIPEDNPKTDGTSRSRRRVVERMSVKFEEG